MMIESQISPNEVGLPLPGFGLEEQQGAIDFDREIARSERLARWARWRPDVLPVDQLTDLSRDLRSLRTYHEAATHPRIRKVLVRAARSIAGDLRSMERRLGVS